MSLAWPRSRPAAKHEYKSVDIRKHDVYLRRSIFIGIRTPPQAKIIFSLSTYMYLVYVFVSAFCLTVIMADHERVINSNKLKCSASKVFRAYMEKLMEAIQLADIPIVTVKLYSKEIISENTRDKILLSNLTKLEKNGILLTAVEDAIKAQPQVLLTLLDILNEFKPADLIAQEMRQQLGICICCIIMLNM